MLGLPYWNEWRVVPRVEHDFDSRRMLGLRRTVESLAQKGRRGWEGWLTAAKEQGRATNAEMDRSPVLYDRSTPPLDCGQFSL